jgi:PAS domain S-box-containing protein
VPSRGPDFRPTPDGDPSGSDPTLKNLHDGTGVSDGAGISQEWFWETDADGRLVRLFGHYEALTGLPRQAVPGWSPATLPDPAVSLSPVTADGHAAVPAGQTPLALRTRILTEAPERTVTIRLKGRPRFRSDGIFQGFRGVATDVAAADITEASQHEPAWRAGLSRNQLLTAAIDACPASLFVADALQSEWPLIYVNRLFTRNTGYTSDEAVGRNCDFLHGPETDPVTVRQLRDAMRRGQPADVEILNYRKDGTPYWAALTLAPLTHQSRVVAHIGIQTDITGRRRHQAELQHRHKLQALGQLAGGVAHEINNLLQPVLTFGELVRTAVAASHPVEAERLGKVLTAAERAREIVHNILRFSRNDTETLVTLDLGATTAEAVAFVHDLLPASVTVVTSGLDRGLGTARINATEMTQVITNLMANAAQAMQGHGEIEVVASTAQVTAHQAAVLGIAPGSYGLVVVSDTGPGIEDAVLAHLFEPYFTTKPSGKGTGLGLSVVYGIIRGWHGTITVSNAPGRGARFTLFIPLNRSGS